MTRKQRPRRWASGTLSGRTSAVESAGRRRITASAATISCQTPCCGRLAPRSDIAGQSDRLAVTIRRDAAAAGWETIPEARAAVSSSSATEATMAHWVAGTAVEPRVAKAARMAAPAVSSAAREAIAQQAVAGSKARGSEAMAAILPRFGGRAWLGAEADVPSAGVVVPARPSPPGRGHVRRRSGGDGPDGRVGGDRPPEESISDAADRAEEPCGGGGWPSAGRRPAVPESHRQGGRT